jgi:shikimate kinase
MKNIILIGFMGAGKSVVGAALSQITGLPLINLDTKIEEEIGMPIFHYFNEHGEEAFRKIEQRLLEKYAQEEVILATGGGVVTIPANRAILKEHTTVLLTANPQILIQRIRADKEHIRPLAVKSTDQELAKLLEQRANFYHESCKFIISTDDKSIQEVAREILKKLENPFDS